MLRLPMLCVRWNFSLCLSETDPAFKILLSSDNIPAYLRRALLVHARTVGFGFGSRSWEFVDFEAYLASSATRCRVIFSVDVGVPRKCLTGAMSFYRRVQRVPRSDQLSPPWKVVRMVEPFGLVLDSYPRHFLHERSQATTWTRRFRCLCEGILGQLEGIVWRLVVSDNGDGLESWCLGESHGNVAEHVLWRLKHCVAAVETFARWLEGNVRWSKPESVLAIHKVWRSEKWCGS